MTPAVMNISIPTNYTKTVHIRVTTDEGTEPGRGLVPTSTAKLRSFLATLDRATRDGTAIRLSTKLTRTRRLGLARFGMR